MRIWIDLSAPAHPVVFRPLVRRLREAGPRRRGDGARLRADARAGGDRRARRAGRGGAWRALRRRQAAQPRRPLGRALALGAHPPALRPRRRARLERPADRGARAARARRRPLRLRVGDVPAHDRLPPRAARDRARRDPARAAAALRRRAAQAAPLPRAQGGVLPPRLRARPRHPRAGRSRPGAHRRRDAHAADARRSTTASTTRSTPICSTASATTPASTRSCCRACASRPRSCGGSPCHR